MKEIKKNMYASVDKISGVPWDFIKPVCGNHKDSKSELVLTESGRGPVYRCSSEQCGFEIPAAIHERLLDEIVKILNLKGGLIGYAWKKRIMGHLYAFEIYEYDFETGVIVGIKRLS